MIRIAVCDDEERILKVICREIQSCFLEKGAEVEIIPYLSGVKMREDIFRGVCFQVLFLDISMPDMNGILLAQHLKKHSPNTMILFLSSREEAVFEAIKTSPFRFIRKRTFRAEISDVVQDILDAFAEKEVVRLLISDKKGQLSLNPYEVIYAEACNKSTVLSTSHGKLEPKVTFSVLEKELEPYGFIKIHRSILVNFRYIRSIQGTELHLDTGQILPISKHRLLSVKTQFQNLLQED